MRPSLRVLFSLSLRQLGRRLPARVGWLGAATVALGFFVVIAAVVGRLRVATLLADALGWMCWLGAAPAALAAATDPAAAAEREGTAALALHHGAPPRALVAARLGAAMAACALRVALPGVVLCLALALWAGSGALALAALPALAVAVLAGGAIGAIAGGCGELLGPRGALGFAVVAIAPWWIADAWSLPNVSLPGLVALSARALFGTLAGAGWP